MKSYDVKPKQSLGQNFLVDQNIAENIIDAIGPQKDDYIIEIGPGYGILTRELVQRTDHLTAVEIDRRLAEKIEAEFEIGDKFKLIQKDFLKVDLQELAQGQMLRIVGNVPYNITSPIMFKVLEERSVVQDLTMLIQKEVADRIVAGPNCKEYGILSVVSQAYADVKKLLNVPRTVFNPKPKIESTLIQWTFTDKRSQRIKDHDFFRAVVRQAFGQRRKMLRKSLKDLFVDKKITFDETLRPEQLSVEDWILLTNELL